VVDFDLTILRPWLPKYIPVMVPPSVRLRFLNEALGISPIVACTNGKKDIRMAVFDVRPYELAFVIRNANRIVMEHGAINESFLWTPVDKRSEEGGCSRGCSCSAPY
jgi:hypothetical protein